ncbi:MAG: hypothetical protein GXZ07_00530 [Firmicutes bacterium]|nr:hypothetical protein [Bacillota bacterium]
MKREFKKPKPVDFKVIKGGGQEQKKKLTPGKKPLFFILLFLALFLLGQILTGWVWGVFGQKSIQTIIAGEGSLELTYPVSGLITFDETIIFSPRSGFIDYLVEEGVRVPVGAELARISPSPPEEADVGAAGGDENGADYLSRFKDWFLGSQSLDEKSSLSLFPENDETIVFNSQAGLISLKIDGWERYGPNSTFPYLTEEEFNRKPSQDQYMCNGQKVSRSAPLLRIINNYTWYFSAVLPASAEEIIAGQAQVVLYFSFSPNCPVMGERVEMEKDGEVIKVTWAINQFMENFYNQRWCRAEIVYERLEGNMIPKSTLLEKDGKKGVYIIEKGYISFREVQILGEKDGYYLVENLDTSENVVLSPDKKLREGQRFFW